MYSDCSYGAAPQHANAKCVFEAKLAWMVTGETTRHHFRACQVSNVRNGPEAFNVHRRRWLKHGRKCISNIRKFAGLSPMGHHPKLQKALTDKRYSSSLDSHNRKAEREAHCTAHIQSLANVKHTSFRNKRVHSKRYIQLKECSEVHLG